MSHAVPVIAYETAEWHELFVMVGGASAALAGLLFVAVSLNLEHVLKYRPLPAVASQSVSLLIAVVVASALGLAPGQSSATFGIELLALGVVVTAVLVASLVRGLASLPGDRLYWRVWRLGTVVIAAVPLLGAGVSLTAGAGGGMYWVLAWVVVALILATYNAWVLLIEIRR